MVERHRVETSSGTSANPEPMQWQFTDDFASMENYMAYAQARMYLAITKHFHRKYVARHIPGYRIMSLEARAFAGRPGRRYCQDGTSRPAPGPSTWRTRLTMISSCLTSELLFSQ
jgi:hypothetical protein